MTERPSIAPFQLIEPIPSSLVLEKLAACKSNLDEIDEALATEMGKPISQRDPHVLGFIESQRQKYAFACVLLTELTHASLSQQQEPPIH